jgi:hypothetical protein
VKVAALVFLVGETEMVAFWPISTEKSERKYQLVPLLGEALEAVASLARELLSMESVRTSMGKNTTSNGPNEGTNLRFERETFGMFFRLYCCGKETL